MAAVYDCWEAKTSLDVPSLVVVPLVWHVETSVSCDSLGLRKERL